MKHDYYPMPKPDLNAGKGNQGEKPDTSSDPSGRGTMGYGKNMKGHNKMKGYGKSKP